MGASPVTDQSFCPECPRALLCIGQDPDRALPLAVCSVCTQVIELDPHSTLALQAPILQARPVETPLVPPRRSICPRIWIFEDGNLFYKGVGNNVGNNFLCYHCRQIKKGTIGYNNGGFWDPTSLRRKPQ